MKIHKKAIMVDFLVAVIIGLMIFIPTCIGVSKLLRLSDQATDNFGEVVSNIQKLVESKKPEDVTTMILIMDKDTSIITYKANQDREMWYENEYCQPGGKLCETKTEKFLVDPGMTRSEITGEYEQKIYYVSYKYPSQCQGKDCICLCQEETYADEQKYPDTKNVGRDSTTILKHINRKKDCTQQLCEKMESINIAPFAFYRQESDQRRLLLEISKESQTIRMDVK